MRGYRWHVERDVDAVVAFIYAIPCFFVVFTFLLFYDFVVDAE